MSSPAVKLNLRLNPFSFAAECAHVRRPSRRQGGAQSARPGRPALLFRRNVDVRNRNPVRGLQRRGAERHRATRSGCNDQRQKPLHRYCGGRAGRRQHCKRSEESPSLVRLLELIQHLKTESFLQIPLGYMAANLATSQARPIWNEPVPSLFIAEVARRRAKSKWFRCLWEIVSSRISSPDLAACIHRFWPTATCLKSGPFAQVVRQPLPFLAVLFPSKRMLKTLLCLPGCSDSFLDPHL